MLVRKSIGPDPEGYKEALLVSLVVPKSDVGEAMNGVLSRLLLCDVLILKNVRAYNLYVGEGEKISEKERI